jgi:hypothetical protein
MSKQIKNSKIDTSEKISEIKQNPPPSLSLTY